MTWIEFPRIFYPSVLHVHRAPTPKNLTIYNPTTGLTNLLFNFPEGPYTNPHTDFQTIVVYCSAISNTALGIYFGPNSPHNLSIDLRENPPHNASNLSAELWAVHKSLKLARNIANAFGPERICIMKIVVVTSCTPIVRVVTQWMQEWDKKEWSSADKYLQEVGGNRPGFERLDQFVDEMVDEDGLEVKLWLVEPDDVAEATALAREAGK